MSDSANTPENKPKRNNLRLALLALLFILLCYCAYLAGGSSNTRTTSTNTTARPTSRPATLPVATRRPIALSGRGDNVVDFDKWTGPALAQISYRGDRNFSVTSYDANGNYLDLLVNTIGRYDGVVPVDFSDGEQTTRFEVEAATTGTWEITIVPIDQAERTDKEGTFGADGDAVFWIRGPGELDTLRIDATRTDGHFAITAYGSARALLVNEIAPYSGTVVVPNYVKHSTGDLFLIIESDGEWAIAPRTK